jgi:hypothetical protein
MNIVKTLFSRKGPYAKVFESAPGPAPWYLNQPANDLSSFSSKLRWDRDLKTGPTLLKDSSGRVRAAASIYTYVWRFSKTHFIVWFANPSAVNDESLAGEVCFQLYAISQLDPLPTEKITKADALRFVTASQPLAEHRLPRNLALGITSTSFPAPFNRCPEFFVLVSEPSYNSPKLNLWRVDPSAESITVAAQDWFTKGAYDFGYQWITRIVRDPDSRDLAGDGIRIGKFLLTPDGTAFKLWLDGPPING